MLPLWRRWGIGAVLLFSFSLYLTHWPVLALTHLVLTCQSLPITAQFYLLMGLGVPLCLGIAYGFHLLFERRFLSTRPPTSPEPFVIWKRRGRASG